MNSVHRCSAPRRQGSKLAVGLSVMMLAVTLTACSSTASPTPGTSSSTRSASSKPPIPASAFTDDTGITSKSVTVANISTLTAGLFTGAVVGSEAYADFVNSQGGVNGRKLIINSSSDNFQGAMNKQLTTAAVQSDLATVGGFSLEDSFGGTVLAGDPGVPNVAESLDASTNALPNSFSPNPAAGGYYLGPLVYLKKKYPNAVLHTGALIANYGSAETIWSGEKAAMEHLGYEVV
jgi:hypothetical protein